MNRNQIKPLLVSYVDMNQVNDLSNSVCTRVQQFISASKTPDPNLITLIKTLNAENELLTKSLNLEQSLNHTETVRNNDKIRDNYCTTIYQLVKVLQGSPIQKDAKAAEAIYRILRNHGGNPSRFAAEKQSSIMESTFSDIDTHCLDDLKTLGMMPLYNGMKVAQAKYKESELLRNTDRANKKTTEPAYLIVKRVMLAYADVEDFLNIMVRLSADTYIDLVGEIDVLVSSINTKARASKTNAKTEVLG